MSQLPSEILLGDIDALFCAVTARLRCIADGSGAAHHPDANDRIRAGVLDCVTALDHVHEMLAHEIERRHRLEQVLRDTQAALACAPPEFAAALGLSLRVPPANLLITHAPEPARAA
jgi:hypothetical protein